MTIRRKALSYTTAMLFIHTALKQEAAPLIERLALKRDNRIKGLSVFSSAQILLLIGGVGPEKTSVSISALAATVSKLTPPEKINVALNIGACGAVEKFPIGSLYRISQVSSNGSKSHLFSTFSTAEIPQAELKSFNAPLLKAVSAGKEIQLADMEGFAFLEAAAVSFPDAAMHCLKIVSDHLDPGQFESRKLYELFEPNLKTIIGFVQNLIRTGRRQKVEAE